MAADAPIRWSTCGFRFRTKNVAEKPHAVKIAIQDTTLLGMKHSNCKYSNHKEDENMRGWELDVVQYVLTVATRKGTSE